MHTRHGLKPITIALSAVVFLQLLFSTDYLISPLSARYYCDSIWVPQPNLDEVVWLPYKTYCERFQTIESNPYWFLIDDYPDEDLPNCKELGTIWRKELEESVGTCTFEPVPGYSTFISYEQPLSCNGYVSLPEKAYMFGAFIENYRQFFDIICPGYPTQTLSLGVATKYYVREPVGPDEIIEGKNRGNPSCGLSAGNPVNIATGNKFHAQQDARLPEGLVISRYYNSSDPESHPFGRNWRGSYSRNIEIFFSGDQSKASLTLVSDDGAESYWSFENGVPVAPPDAQGKLDVAYDNGFVLGFTLVTKDNAIETYDANGKLLSISNEDGQILNFTYTNSLLTAVTALSGRALSYWYLPDGKISQISSSNGSTWTYSYDGKDNLARVEFPDGSNKVYHYENEVFPNALTGVTDENGNRIRSWAYDDSGRAILSTYGDAQSPVERHTISYNPDGTTTTSDPSQLSVDHTFKTRLGVAKFETASNICGECGNSKKSTTYDERGNRDQVTDFAGNTTDYDYTPDNLIQKVTYAVDTPQQFEIVYSWDVNLRKPAQLTRETKTTGFTYNIRGQVLVKSETDTQSLASRTWTYTYFETPALPALVGKLISIDGPRTDVADITQFEYYTSDHAGGHYRSGDLKAVVNPLGHRTEYLEYDGNGQLLELSDANGIITSFTYHPRGWKSSTTTDGKTTLLTYDHAGNLTGSTQPDGSYISYEYDIYQRLTSIEDGLGNRIEYTLDTAGNRTSERTFDDLGVLRRQLRHVYNSLKRLDTTIDGNNGETRYEYDENGNRISIVDANQNTTSYEYDALERLVKITDPIQGETWMTNDSRGHPVSIMDPMGNITQYAYDGLDNQTGLDSPDTGHTFYEYDDAGNRTATTDARGVRTEFAFDAMNRLLEVTYPDSALDVTYGYDAGTNGKGRMTSMTDAAGRVEYAYDRHGNLVSETRTIEGDQFITSFAYNSADRLVQITYPSGMVIDYLLDASGQVTSIQKSENSGTETLVDEVLYAPFGPVTSFFYGNGSTYSSTLNLDYEAEQLQSGPGLNWSLNLDPLGNIVAITDQDNSQQSQAFAYDDIYRLNSAQGGYGFESFTYDANSNRTHFVSEISNESYTYEPQSNLLTVQGNWTFTRDATGNRIGKLNADGLGQLYAFGDNNRLSQVSIRDGSGDLLIGNYVYNGHGQRVNTSMGDENIRYIYGLSGELLGEYSVNTDGTFTEYVYLNAQPIAAITRKVDLTRPAGNELILDNGDPGTSSTGAWRTSRDGDSYGGDYLFASKASNRTYRWTVTPPGTSYEVYAWWVDKRNQSDSVDYTISYGTAETATVTMNHKTGGSQWQLLGEYHSSDGQDYVEVSSRSDRFVADAIRWVELKDPVVTWIETTNFIHFDHLGTPRRVTDQDQNVIWSWDSTPFGNSEPDQDPDGDLQGYVLNLRFPGQYYDKESGLHYNYHRTYDPGTGRYIESDPIGLAGGLNSYAYVGNNPLRYIDAFGLYQMCHRPVQGIIPGRHCYAKYSDGSTSSFSPSGTGPEKDAGNSDTQCTNPKEPEKDDCIKKAIKKCKGSNYHFTRFNCCHCMEQAMKECLSEIPKRDWPNYPINPGPQFGEPGYSETPIYGPNLGDGR